MYNKLKYYFKIFLYYFIFLLSCTFILPVFMLRPRNVANGYVYSIVMKQFLRIYGLKWRIRNSEVFDKNSEAVIIANHQSIFDALGLFHVWEYTGKMCVVIKKEFFYAATVGLAAYLVGSVFVDRKNAKSAYKSLEATTDVLTKEKTKIWVFPEGTRNLKQKTKLLPFKKGAFQMAVAAQVPIIPVVFSPYYFIDREKRIFDTGYIIIQCLEPVPTFGLTVDAVPELSERLHGIMLEAYEKLSYEVMSNLPKKN